MLEKATRPQDEGQRKNGVKLDPLKFKELTLSEQQQGSTTRKVDLEKIVGTCPTVTVSMNGVSVKCLLDSGSQVSTITESFYDTHFSQFQDIHDCSSYIKLTASNGLAVPLHGLLIVSLVLDDHRYDAVPILVVKDSINPQMRARKLETPGLIGSNMLDLICNVILSNKAACASPVVRKVIQFYSEEQ